MCLQYINTCNKTVEEIVANIADIIKTNVKSLCLDNAYDTVYISIGRKPGEPNNVSYFLITHKNSTVGTKGFIVFRSICFLTSKKMLESASHIKRYILDIAKSEKFSDTLTVIL